MKNKTMKAAVLEQFKKDLVIKELPIPTPKRGEVLIKVRASGLCGTDLHIQDGRLPTIKLPYVPGHETAGEVCALGEDVNCFEIGDRVIVAIDILCNTCRFCTTGRGNLCVNLTRLGFERDGGHQEYMIAPATNLLKFNDNVPFEKAAIIPDAVACMYHAIKNQAQVRATDRICILGVGGLGFQGIQIAKHFGAEIFCTSRNDEKLEIAKKYGADHIINTSKQNLYEVIKDITSGEMCDAVFDNIGINSSIQTGLDICRPGGKVIMVGYSEDTFQAEFQGTAMKEKEIIGIRGSNRRDLVETIRLVEKGIIDPYIYKTYALDDINLALEDLKNGKSLGRTVLKM
ncbi:MAG: alcohol dehydrogenase catalytic domain-containing protein [Clostridiaceae bacterium]|nr:alcohol dehydrogenase catalytic domain-containing protein [Clostridiaceae bacterium]